ncbi:hypothetical protein D3C76_1524800 [compost metagenome]
MADEAVVPNIDKADGIKVFAKAMLDQQYHPVMADQRAVGQPHTVTDAHQRWVGELAACVDIEVATYRVKVTPAGEVSAPLKP